MSTPTRTSRPTPLSVSRPTAPLPTLAAEALARLELRLAPAGVAAAVVTYRKAALRVAALGELADLADAGIELSDMHADDLAHAEDLMAGARATLAKAGRLDLIGGAV